MPDATMHCRLCPEVTTAPDLRRLLDDTADHVRIMHPDVWDGHVKIEEETP